MKKQRIFYVFYVTLKFTFFCECSMENIALNKPATQISQYLGFSPDRVVDGIDGTVPQSGSCSHTAGFAADPPESTPWLEVDLLHNYYIKAVAITASNKDGRQLIHDFSIDIYKGGESIGDAVQCYYHEGQGTKGTTVLYFCTDIIKGRYVRITIKGKSGVQEMLALCEVRVFGTQDINIISSFLRFENVEISTLPDMTYRVQGYGQCAMKCYVLPMCRIFSVKSLSKFYQCDIFTQRSPKLVANSTGSPGTVLYIN